jgi:protein-tyrosine phosphatase
VHDDRVSTQLSAGNRYRVCFVCSGNICRSPMAEWVTRSEVSRLGLDSLVTVDSAGTGAWHVGEAADERAVRVARAAGYELAGATPPHIARQFDPVWFAERELLVALDRGHAAALRDLAPDAAAAARVRLLREFDTGAGADPRDLDVADPYYGDLAGFERCLQVIEASCAGLLAAIGDAVSA